MRARHVERFLEIYATSIEESNLRAATPKVRRYIRRPHHGGEDNMTKSRLGAVAIALSIGCGFAGGGSTQGSAKGQKLSDAVVSSKRMAGGQGVPDAKREPQR